MSNPLDLITKQYVRQHPVYTYSAAHILYTFELYPDFFEDADRDIMPALYDRMKEEGIDLPDKTKKMLMEAVMAEEDLSRLIRMMRRPMTPDVANTLLNKLLARDAEALPEVKALVLKTFSDHGIENCTRFLIRCEEDCSAWILENYAQVRNSYTQSMLCLVLGFRASPDVIPFLMAQLERFEKNFPEEHFADAPLLALREIAYQNGKQIQYSTQNNL